MQHLKKQGITVNLLIAVLKMIIYVYVLFCSHIFVKTVSKNIKGKKKVIKKFIYLSQFTIFFFKKYLLIFNYWSENRASLSILCVIGHSSPLKSCALNSSSVGVSGLIIGFFRPFKFNVLYSYFPSFSWF